MGKCLSENIDLIALCCAQQGDEAGRRRVSTLVRDLLTKLHFSDDLVPVAMSLLVKVCKYPACFICRTGLWKGSVQENTAHSTNVSRILGRICTNAAPLRPLLVARQGSYALFMPSTLIRCTRTSTTGWPLSWRSWAAWEATTLTSRWCVMSKY